MPARNPAHQRAIIRVALLSRWRPPDDPELIHARRALAMARAEAHLAEATSAAVTAAAELRALGAPEHRPGDERAQAADR